MRTFISNCKGQKLPKTKKVKKVLQLTDSTPINLPLALRSATKQIAILRND